MIISIRGNWKDAEQEHNDYVNVRVSESIKRYDTRIAADPHVVAFLREVKKDFDPAVIKPLLKSIPEFRKTREALLDPHERDEFVHDVESTAPDATSAKAKSKGKRAAARLTAGLPYPERGALYQMLARFEKGCGSATLVAAFHRCLATEVLYSLPKPKDFLKERLQPYLDGYAARDFVDILTVQFLRDFGTDIGTAAFSRLEHTVKEFQTAESFLTEQEKERFHTNLHAVFDYDRFTTKDISEWNAYSLCKRSRTRTCPYCNQAYAFTVFRPDDTGGFRPTLDHFLPKQRFPHLALSLNNLIPSCYTCNSNLKGSADFHAKPHLHPLYDDEPITFSIELPGTSLVDLMNDFETLKSHTRLKVQCDPLHAPARNSIETFLIEERYASHHDEAIEFASLRLDLASGRLEEISNLLGGRSEARLLRFDRARYSQTLLGKMYADIYDNFKR